MTPFISQGSIIWLPEFLSGIFDDDDGGNGDGDDSVGYVVHVGDLDEADDDVDDNVDDERCRASAYYVFVGCLLLRTCNESTGLVCFHAVVVDLAPDAGRYTRTIPRLGRRPLASAGVHHTSRSQSFAPPHIT